MPHRDDPRVFSTIFRLGRLLAYIKIDQDEDSKMVERTKCIFTHFQIVFQPFVLRHDRFNTVIGEVIVFGIQTDYVNRSNIVTVEHIVRKSWHIEAISVIWKITESRKMKLEIS